MTDSINWCDLKKNAKHIGEVSTSRVDGSPTGAEILTSTDEVTGQVRDTLAGKLKKFDVQLSTQESEFEVKITSFENAFNNIANSQFIVTNFGNWSSVAGQQIVVGDELNGYEYPDDSGDVYAVNGSVTLPITRPSSPIGDSRFYLASAVNKSQIDELVDIYNPIFHTGYSSTLDKCRIPAICSDIQGNIYAFCDQRRGYSDVPNYINIGMRKSVDNGLTWSDIKIVMNRGTSNEEGISDPCVIYDGSNDTIYCFAVSTDKNINDPSANLVMYMSKSNDKGDSWTDPTPITTNTTNYKSFFQGPGNSVAKDGWIYVPIQYWHSSDPSDPISVVGAIRSNDGGVTWEELGIVQNSTQENALAFYGDRLIMTAKVGNGSGFGRVTYEYDFISNGWGPALWGQNKVSTQGSLLEVNIANKFHSLLKIENAKYFSAERKDLTLSVSHNGYNYRDVMIIRSELGMGYSSMTYTGNYLHILYEDSIGCVYKRLNLEDVLSTGGSINEHTLILSSISQTYDNGSVMGLHPDVVRVELKTKVELDSIVRGGDHDKLEVVVTGGSNENKITATSSIANSIYINSSVDSYINMTINSSMRLLQDSNNQWRVINFNDAAADRPTLIIDAATTELNLTPVMFYDSFYLASNTLSFVNISSILQSPRNYRPGLLKVLFKDRFVFSGIYTLGWDNQEAHYAFRSGMICEITLDHGKKPVISNASKIQVLSNDELLTYDASVGSLSVPLNVSSILFRGHVFSGDINFISAGLRDDALTVSAWGPGANQKFKSLVTNAPANFKQLYQVGGADVTLVEGGVLTVNVNSQVAAMTQSW